MLIALMAAILVACSSTAAPPSPVASAPTAVATIEPTSEEQPTVVPTVTEQRSTAEQPTDEPTVEEQPTVEPTVAEQPTVVAADGSTPPLELTWAGAAATLRDMLATFGKGDISKFLSTKLRTELASSRTTDEALGLYELPLQSFEVRDALNEPTEVLLVPATLRYPEFEEERLYEMVVEDGQWRVTGSGKVSATGDPGTCEPATTEFKGSVNIAPPFCVVWADTFDDEQGFRITLQYLGTGGETFTYETGPHATQFAVPEQDRPRTEESRDLCARRGSFSIQVVALREGGQEIVGGMAMDGECGMAMPAPEATQPADATTDRLLYVRFDYE